MSQKHNALVEEQQERLQEMSECFSKPSDDLDWWRSQISFSTDVPTTMRSNGTELVQMYGGAVTNFKVVPRYCASS